MNNISRSLIIAGSGNQIPPGPPPKIWKPFFQNFNLRVIMPFASFTPYYDADANFIRHSMTGLSAANIKEQIGAYATEAAYIEYLKTLHPVANFSTKDGAFNASIALDWTYASTTNQSGYDWGGQIESPADGYVYYEKYFNFTGTNPAGNFTGRVVTTIFYKLMNQT